MHICILIQDIIAFIQFFVYLVILISKNTFYIYRKLLDKQMEYSAFWLFI